jgi:hypothetical protein
MLLAIADFSDDDGRAYPAVCSLASKCRMKARNARYLLQELEASGELSIERNAGPKGANLYRICVPLPLQYGAPLQSTAPLQYSAATPAMECTLPLQHIAPEPSLNRHEPSIGNSNELLVASGRPAKTSGKKKAQPVPHQDIIAAYHETLPACPRIRDWTPARAALLRARWSEEPKRQSLDYWRKLFAYVAESDFLTGKTSTPGRKPFTASLEWLLKPENFAKVREGRYHNEGQP